MRSLADDFKRLGIDVWDNIGDYYQQVVLGIPRFPQHQQSSEPENSDPGFGGARHSSNFFPPKGIDGDILPPETPEAAPLSPEKSTADIFAELRATRIEPSETGNSKSLPAPEPDRDGPDFDR